MTEIKGFDQRRDIVIPGDKEEAIAFSVDHFITTGKKAISERGAFYVALSGGSTPKVIFEQLTADSLDWEKVYLFWSDERCVPPDDNDSNYKMAMDAGFKSLPIPEKQIFRMKGEVHPEESAQLYEEAIKNNVPGQVFDLVMLGMGNDCHTASLFPKTHGLHSTDRMAIANFLPEKDVWRLTLTFQCINRARHIAIYVLGEGKAEAIHTALVGEEDFDSYPIQHVGTSNSKALWIMDRGAGASLQQSSL